MCGIAGVIHNDPRRSIDLDILNEMTDIMRYRGPDDRGVWIGNGTGLGHRRLSIIDINGGKQPMTTRDSECWITYNGEIYNYIELRRELEQSGINAETRSDTEVLLQICRHQGVDGLGKLNGMFAFALWDENKRTLFAARDRMGIKPFYYVDLGYGLAFASEIKSLLAHPDVNPILDEHALQDYIDLQYCLDDKTLFKGIKRLLPGSYLLWKDEKFETFSYWDLKFGEENTNEKSPELLNELITDAVRLRLRSDVPVGSHLSGGLDSSAISCVAADLLDSPLKVFTGGFDTAQRYDESKYAKIVAGHVGAEYYQIFPNALDLEQTFDDMVFHLDEPVAGAAVFPQYFLSKLAAKHVKVVLGGQGGDELFCGYTRYLIGYLEQCLQNSIYGNAPLVGDWTLADIEPHLSYLGGFEPTMQKLFGSNMFADASDRYYRLLQRSEDMDGILKTRDLLDPKYSTIEIFRSEFNKPDSNDLIDRMMYIDLKNHLQSLLHLEDRTSMAASLESRLPLLDYRIVEFAIAQSPESRFSGGKPKNLLRQAVSDYVPPAILNRKDKMGFPVPIFEWFSGELKPFVEDILLGDETRSRGFFDMTQVEQSIRSEKPFGRTVWGLLSLELWFRRFFDAR
ncbi:MAG: asparagine synthase (glutamine-hydrolyzing) [Candidatus Latescibacterota bacterium]|nr:asparagine synthase (glutamine-hydrolyzing) [Candidatus Latescibacterota bacterium]